VAALINGQSLEDVVFQALDLSGHVARSAVLWDAAALANGSAVFLQSARTVGRRVRYSVELRPASLIERVAVQDALARRLAGVLELVTSDAPARVLLGTLEEATVGMPAGPIDNPLYLLDLVFNVPDPRRYDVETQLRALSSTPVAVPVGAGATAPRIVLFGAATAVVNPVVHLYRGDGELAASLELVTSLGSNTWLDIDCQSEWVYRVASGVATLALEVVAGGAFPIFSAEDASTVAGPFPRVGLSSASGTPTGVALWRRTW